MSTPVIVAAVRMYRGKRDDERAMLEHDGQHVDARLAAEDVAECDRLLGLWDEFSPDLAQVKPAV